MLTTLLGCFLLIGSVSCFQALKLFKSIRSPLAKIPGPWYAPLTTMHLRYGFSTGSIWKLAERSHHKYGPIVRLGPRQIWVSDKTAMKQILATKDLPKVGMYAEISRDRNAPGLFGEIRPNPHKQLKRFLTPAFTVAYVDGLDTIFCDVAQRLLDKYARETEATGAARTDMMDDLHRCALDSKLLPSLTHNN